MVKAGHTIYLLNLILMRITRMYVIRSNPCGRFRLLEGLIGNKKTSLKVCGMFSLENEQQQIYFSLAKAMRDLNLYKKKRPPTLLVISTPHSAEQRHAIERALRNHPEFKIVPYHITDEEISESRRVESLLGDMPQVVDIISDRHFLVDRKFDRKAELQRLRREGRGINYRR